MDGDDVSVTDTADGRVSTITVVSCDVDADEVGVVTLETHDVIAVLLSLPVVHGFFAVCFWLLHLQLVSCRTLAPRCNTQLSSLSFAHVAIQ